MNTNYPKVLLLCSLSQNTANGITIANLFRNWPEDRIAVAEFNDCIEDVYVSNIANYYLLGDRETKYIWPFCYLRRPSKSCSYQHLHAPSSKRKLVTTRENHKSRLRQTLLSLQLAYLNNTGLALVSKRFRISAEFEKWIDNFGPDILYVSVGDICKMDFLSGIQDRLGVPMAVHIFDDYVDSKYQYTFFKNYWKQRLDKSFRNFLEHSDLCLSISEKMASEYSNRYSKRFFAFHNPIDREVWLDKGFQLPQYAARRRQGDPFSFVYAGKINKDTAAPLARFISAIETLNQLGEHVALHIYSPYPSDEIRRVMGTKVDAYLKGRVEYRELPEKFRESDALLLPLDFTNETIKYIRLSMLTKATEYMVSGRPIFLYAPKQVAVSEYLLSIKSAFHVDEKTSLQDSILEFINNDTLREETSANAFHTAIQKHLSESVCERFRTLLCNCSLAKKTFT